MTDVDVVVVGAGLAGLTAADILHRAGMSLRVVEARGRVGGRIMTVTPEGLGPGAWFDLGATWMWDDQPRVRALAAELGLQEFRQYREGRGLSEDIAGVAPTVFEVTPPSPVELRLLGGAQELCFGLADRLPEDSIAYATSVVEVAEGRDGITVTTTDTAGHSSELNAGSVVVAVPPRLARQRIHFTPPLPAGLVEVMEATPTWMGTALKCVAIYDAPFWREQGWAGLALSQGPLLEVHDACTDDASAAALWGFVSADHRWRDLGPNRRTELVLAHLERFFGARATDPVQCLERDWANDPNTNDEVVWVGETADYGHPAFAAPALGGRLAWAGAETVAEGGGHMEAAVRSGQRAAGLIVSFWSPNRGS